MISILNLSFLEYKNITSKISISFMFGCLSLE